MNTSPVYLASDIHLGAVSPETERRFITWLEAVGAESKLLVLNGDLFDFWFEYRQAIPRGYTRVLGALSALVDSGVTVHLTGGNHDWWGGSYLRDEIGVTFHQRPVELDLAGHRVLVAHGDGLGPGDAGYRVLQRVLQNPVFVAAFRWTHPDIGGWLARRVSSTAQRQQKQGTSGSRSRSPILEQWALDQLQKRSDLAGITMGHTHLPLLRVSPSGRWYLNTGDWVDHRTFAILRPGAPPTLYDWTRDGASERVAEGSPAQGSLAQGS